MIFYKLKKDLTPTGWIVGVKSFSSLPVSKMGFFNIIKCPQINGFHSMAYLRFPFLFVGAWYNTLKPANWHTAFGILSILFVRNFSQIAQPVVSPVAINMVQMRLRPTSIQPKPNNAMVFVSFPSYFNPQIFVDCLPSRATVFFGKQMPSFCVVVIQLTDICLGKCKIFSSHINSLSVVVVRSLKVLQDLWGFVILQAKRGGVAKKRGLPFEKPQILLGN